MLICSYVDHQLPVRWWDILCWRHPDTSLPSGSPDYQLGFLFDDISNHSDDDILAMKYTGCNTALETLTLNQPPVIDVIDALDGDDCGELNADTTFMSMKIRLNKQLALYRIRCAYGGVGWNIVNCLIFLTSCRYMVRPICYQLCCHCNIEGMRVYCQVDLSLRRYINMFTYIIKIWVYI